MNDHLLAGRTARSGEGRTARSAGVTAVLGPTNTGKTHYAIDRMLAHPTGAIGLPLRLLAREVYGRVVERVGAEHVALITGEEKIKPKRPRYWIATVEAMPRDLDVSFVAIDEIQLAADLDRGHVFTDRLLNRRGRDETLVIGALTMQRSVEQLLPGVRVATRPRLSKLTFAGEKKLSRLPHRTAIVAFSAEEVYAIAELIRRQRGGAAVVLGALSPRTRNSQVALYQNGDVDYLVATDAIGMGLNLDLDHVAFAGDRKFDGWQYRRLNPSEMAQIAGRAGRHLRDGTFGTTGRCPPFGEDLIEALEDHRFDPVPILQWRNSDLDFSTFESLQTSLDLFPGEPGLTRAPLAEDVMVLDIAARDPAVRKAAKTRADVARLWDVCQVPDYRKVSPSAHAELALTLFHFVVRAGHIPDAWFSGQLGLQDRTEGDIDTLSARIAQVRTLTYIANRPDWLKDPEHWQGVTRQLEDRLSDALHERLAQRFVDRRTSVLMRRLRENVMLEAEITSGGDVLVEGQHVGQLHGFRFTPDPQAAGEAARALNAAALKALGGEIEARAERFSAAVDESFALANDGTIRWLGEPVAKIAAGDKLLSPKARILADEHLTGASLEAVQRRLDLWLGQHVRKLLGPLMDLEAGTGLDGIARGIAYQVAEALGVLERTRVADEMKSLDQGARGTLRKLGLRFGAYHIYLPALLKPAPRALAAQLWALQHGGVETIKGLDEVPHLAASGRTSFPADSAVPKGLYRAAGFRVCGARAVRVDILERLADLIRPAVAYRPGTTPGTPPPGTADNDGFITTIQMTSLAGCSGEDFASILRSLSYVLDRRPGPAITVPLLPVAPTTPLQPVFDASRATVDDHGANDTGIDGDGSGAAQESKPDGEGGGSPDKGSVHTAPSTTSDIGGADEVPPAAEADRPEAAIAGGPARTDAAQAVAETATTSDIGQAPEIPPAVEGPEHKHDIGTVPEERQPIRDDGGADQHDGSDLRQDGPVEVQGEAATTSDLGVTPEIPPVPGETFNADLPPVAEQPPEVPYDEAPSEPERHAHEFADAAADPKIEAPGPEGRPDAASARTPAGDVDAASAEPVSAGPELAEPALIEVWRPHRTHHHAVRRPERSRGRPVPRPRGAAPVTDRPPTPAPDSSDAASTGGPDAVAPGLREGGQAQTLPDERHRDRRPWRGGGREREQFRDRAKGGSPGDGRDRPAPGHAAPPPREQGGKGRFDQRRDRRGEKGDGSRGETPRPQHVSTSERPARERQPDPNSPFAKLLALKLELERKKE